MAPTATAVRPASRTKKSAKQNALRGGLAGNIKAFAATERLFSLGDPKTDLYLMESGVVALDRVSPLLVRLEQRAIIAAGPSHGLRLSDLNALRALVDETSLNKVTSSNIDRVPLPPSEARGDASLPNPSRPLGKIEASPT